MIPLISLNWCKTLASKALTCRLLFVDKEINQQRRKVLGTLQKLGVPSIWFTHCETIKKSPLLKALKFNTFGDPTIISRFANTFNCLNEILSFIFSFLAFQLICVCFAINYFYTNDRFLYHSYLYFKNFGFLIDERY